MKAKGVEYDMSDFLRSCVERYKELTGVVTLRKAATPFLPEPTRPDFRHCEAGPLVEPTPGEALRAAMGVSSDEPGTRPVVGPKPPEGSKEEEVLDQYIPTQLAPYAAKVFMKVLYAARYARLDLLRTVCALA